MNLTSSFIFPCSQIKFLSCWTSPCDFCLPHLFLSFMYVSVSLLSPDLLPWEMIVFPVLSFTPILLQFLSSLPIYEDQLCSANIRRVGTQLPLSPVLFIFLSPSHGAYDNLGTLLSDAHAHKTRSRKPNHFLPSSQSSSRESRSNPKRFLQTRVWKLPIHQILDSKVKFIIPKIIQTKVPFSSKLLAKIKR